MYDTSLIEEILERPDAALQFEFFQKAMEDEKVRRKTFYDWITEGTKAEFINGEIVIHSPVKKRHWKTNNLFSRLLSFYVSLKSLGEVGTEKVMITLSRNDYEPDVVFFSKEKAKQFTDDQVLFPAPDFVVEILSPSTANHDRTTKKEDYALHEIKEYWIIDPKKQEIEQYLLPEGKLSYESPVLFKCGELIESVVISDFKMDVAAIFDETANTKAMQNFLNS